MKVFPHLLAESKALYLKKTSWQQTKKQRRHYTVFLVYCISMGSRQETNIGGGRKTFQVVFKCPCPEAIFKEKHGMWDPMLKLTIHCKED